MIMKDDIEDLLDLIDMDLRDYEEGKRYGFYFMVFVEDVGMLVPTTWIDSFSEYKEAWNKFMCGQTCVEGGLFYRDVTRFLISKLRHLEAKR